MAVWSSITTSKMEYTRIDADYYHPDYLSEMVIWQELKEKNNVSKLRHLIRTPVRTGRTPRSRLIKDGELCVPFIKTDTLREGSADFNNSDILPARILSDSDYIPNDSVIITIIGATPEIVGRVAIVRSEDPDCVTNQNVAVVCTNERCDPYYLTAFFQTKLGRDQLWRHSRRTEQVNLNCREVERVLVPLLIYGEQKEIGDLVRASFQSTDQSINLYQQAQNLLESELGLDKLNFKKPVGYTAQLSDVINNDRVDADFYHKKYQQLDAIAVKFTIKKVKEISEKLETGIYSQSYSSEGRNYLRGVDINKGFINSKSILKTNLLLANPNTTVVKDDILVTRVGSIGVCAIIEDEHSGSLFSDNLIRIRLHEKAEEEISASYLNLLLNTTYGQMQMVRYSRGSVQQRLNQTQLAQIPIPIIKREVQRKIEKLLDEHRNTKKESQKLLDQAKNRVEQLIEEAAA